jgi:hypothetical protein
MRSINSTLKPGLGLALVIILSSGATGRAEVERPRAGNWQEPIAGLSARVISDYQAPAYRWSSGHRGVDAWVEPGASIHSPITGSVHFAGRVVNRGVISISDDLVIASFEPVCPLVTSGQTVSAGQLIAVHCDEEQSLSENGQHYQHCEVDCVHISARINGEYISPLHLIYGLKPSRLWPLASAD